MLRCVREAHRRMAEVEQLKLTNRPVEGPPTQPSVVLSGAVGSKRAVGVSVRSRIFSAPDSPSCWCLDQYSEATQDVLWSECPCYVAA